MSAILSSLNEPQREAVIYEHGPILIFAGAGSGKTNVLTRRIAYLILERHVRPYNILAVTFTNKAATEMKERISSLIGDSLSRELWAGTFHSLCARMLRERGKEIGISSNFAIYDDSDQLVLVKESIKELNLDSQHYQPRAMLSAISRAKEKLKKPSQVHAGEFRSYYDRAVDRVYDSYQSKLALSNALDFDDLIVMAVRLLQDSESARTHYQRRFEFVHCDEFQDTNESQYQLLKLLSGQHGNLCVVGDDDQSIYAFRGADVQIILNFEADFPIAKLIKLEQNYRSTKTILDAAYHVVKNNQGRADKRLWTENDEGEHIILIEASNENEEANAIASLIREKALSGDRSYQDFAILYRTNAQSRALEEQLINFSIPYKIVGGIRFYERREIKDVLSYLRVVINPFDTVSHRRIINVPARGIGVATIEHIAQHASAMGLTFWDALKSTDSIELGPRARKSVAGYVKLIEHLQARATTRSVSELIQDILASSGYQDDIEKEHTAEAQGRVENLGELVSVAAEFEQNADTDEERSALKFLETVSLVADVDSYTEDANSVTLMTLHSAKGLEFPEVVLAGMEEGIFPHIRSFESRKDMDEERRLCYVGLTRAKKQLYLAYALSRMTFGATHRNAASRFISEIPQRLYIAQGSRPLILSGFESTIDRDTRRSTAAVAPKWSDLQTRTAPKTLLPTVELPYKVGEKVKHDKFGKGTVVTISPDNGDAKVTVAFPAPIGIKTLVASFAKLVKA